MYNIAVIPGDGIGKEVMEATINVLESLDIDFNFTYGEAGDECKENNGEALPDETIELAKNSDACLFGAAGETAADVIVRLRQELKLFTNLRPVKTYPNTNALFEDIDFMIVRENTEGMYIAKEEEYTEEGAIARRIITDKAERRIIDYAFQYAKNNNKSKVTGVHKANVLKITDGLFKEIFYEVAEEYKDEIDAEDFYVDATAIYLITRPKSFEVIVTTNLFGDILSDEGAGLVGGLGMIPSGNIGEDNALFEPVHGSAPDIAGQGIANPFAMMLSACMMLNYLGEYEAEERLNSAILNVLNEAKTLTPDLGGSSSTMEVTEAVKKAL
ncbi:isocitrate/isopropylmalate family dehydrogenase [uncultured Methanobrevibacter sp.]|uniref:isocitrate/isopropylmalate family dehydrogenase n=1 Tax=uncultured Methanobrevibacter sp. TaxID=253161 RepID=UPI0025D35D02|nr:isocitrate/isopropylmalate family dehydrogenase [uncultured Methanobrevibacter sp.]